MDVVSEVPAGEHPLLALLAEYDASQEERWDALVEWLRRSYNRDITLEAVLFLIGVQSRGRGFQPELDRDVKEDLIMEGTFCAFASVGVYERTGMEANGAWIWERVMEPVPELPVEEQEKLLKAVVLRYFEEEFAAMPEEAPWS